MSDEVTIESGAFRLRVSGAESVEAVQQYAEWHPSAHGDALGWCLYLGRWLEERGFRVSYRVDRSEGLRTWVLGWVILKLRRFVDSEGLWYR